MKKYFFSLLLLFTSIIYPQERPDSVYKITEPNQHILDIQERLNVIDFYFDLNSSDIVFPETNENLWLWTFHSLKHQTGYNREDQFPDFISLPLYREYIENSKFDPVKAALGMAQAGAAGYLLYKSVKKYGLFR